MLVDDRGGAQNLHGAEGKDRCSTDGSCLTLSAAVRLTVAAPSQPISGRTFIGSKSTRRRKLGRCSNKKAAPGVTPCGSFCGCRFPTPVPPLRLNRAQRKCSTSKKPRPERGLLDGAEALQGAPWPLVQTESSPRGSS